MFLFAYFHKYLTQKFYNVIWGITAVQRESFTCDLVNEMTWQFFLFSMFSLKETVHNSINTITLFVVEKEYQPCFVVSFCGTPGTFACILICLTNYNFFHLILFSREVGVLRVVSGSKLTFFIYFLKLEHEKKKNIWNKDSFFPLMSPSFSSIIPRKITFDMHLS